jgi:hypothetical protein
MRVGQVVWHKSGWFDVLERKDVKCENEGCKGMYWITRKHGVVCDSNLRTIKKEPDFLALRKCVEYLEKVSSSRMRKPTVEFLYDKYVLSARHP